MSIMGRRKRRTYTPELRAEAIRLVKVGDKSDRGVQYACDDYRRPLVQVGAVASMSRKGDCWDNAVVESFFSKLKTERFTEALRVPLERL
jgi:transposase InsO family protein